jgi:formylglycine-generating enzyme required for sulfatase activity
MANQDDMVWLPGGQFRMGSDTHYKEEAPAHEAMVSGFWIDRTPVTNRQYAAFVEATNYVTVAEFTPRAEDYPGALPEMLKPASLVFVPTSGPVRLDDWSQWWQWTFGADWRHPTGPGSNLDNLWDHPVVHVALADVEAYAAWAGKQLPTEAEWDYAGWAGNWAHEFAWGDELEPDGMHMANVWQGNFPYENSLADRFLRTSPVGSFSPNRFGLYDMIGNVWEWTADWYTRSHVAAPAKACCVPSDMRDVARRGSQDPNLPAIPIPRRVLKGGSHLCAPNYCRRYRPAARHAQPIDSAASHIGFRCVRRAPGPTE